VKKILLSLIASGLLAGCATPEFRQAKDECSGEAFRLYPVQQVLTVVSRTRMVQVPTGQTHCVTTQTGNVANTSCQQVMRTDYVPYLENVMVDVNASPRENAMTQCAMQLCIARYGNADCKTK
jgi:hypothetical protein